MAGAPARHKATAEDGVELSLLYYNPPETAPREYKHPVILCHGLGSNHHAYNMRGDRSIALALCGAGFHTWLLDLRGAGLSSSPAGDWGLQTYVDLDAKAAIDYVCQRHGVDSVHWAGHSMGGLIGLSLLTGGRMERVRSVITLGSGLYYSDSAWALLRPLLPIVSSSPFFDMRGITGFYSHFALYPETVAYPPNVRLSVVRELLRVGFERVPSKVLKQLSTAFDNAGLAVAVGDETVRVAAALQQDCPRPVLMLAGDHDAQCRPKSATRTFQELATPHKRLVLLGRASKTKHGYGHFDLLIGDHVAEEVVPHLTEWMAGLDGPLDKGTEVEGRPASTVVAA